MSKTVKIILAVLISVVIISMSFAAGCILTASSASSPVPGLNISLLNEAWNKITSNYVEPGKIDPTSLNEGAINGMVQGLNDPYSYYLSPTDYMLTQGSFQSSFGGIGATVSMNANRQSVIVNTLKDSPAAKAGIQAEDIILAVDGKSTDGLTVDQVVALVRGPAGTTVKLTVLHSNMSTPVEIDVVRAEIKPPTVEYNMAGDVAYIQITNFYQNTNDEVEAALKALDLKNARGIILDLRDNLGGYVNTMVDIASHFIKSGVIITFRDNQGKTTSESVNPNGIFTDLPMVVLVNHYSASSSEVLTGALQDYQRATIAGTKTFGKGSYDTFYQLSDGSAIYLTIGRWITPKGREIEGTGITPDYTLTETGDAEIQWAVNFLDNKPVQ